jgi:hypothetical protein
MPKARLEQAVALQVALAESAVHSALVSAADSKMWVNSWDRFVSEEPRSELTLWFHRSQAVDYLLVALEAPPLVPPCLPYPE